MKIIVIGMGIIGKIEYDVLKDKFNPDYIDKYKGSSINGLLFKNYNEALKETRNINYDMAIVCVPTELKDGITLDMTEVHNAVNSVNANVYLIKSTLNVGTCDEIHQMTGKRIVHSPEHSGSTQHCNNYEYNFTILGGDKKDCHYVQQIYQEIYDARHIFEIVDAKTSELSKLMQNCWLATKVSFCTSFWDTCKKLNLSYEELRKCFILDPRINPSHTFVYDEHPYWDSHCLNKDVPAAAFQLANQFLINMYYFNNDMKENNK